MNKRPSSQPWKSGSTYAEDRRRDDPAYADRQNAWASMSELPPRTEQSDRMSKDLRILGFKFVGSTICYALVQSVGMVNDHVVECFRYDEVKAMA